MRSRHRPFRLLAISQLDRPGAGAAAGAAAGTSDAAAWFAALAAAGVDAVQLREKRLDDLALYELARLARAALPPPALLLVNGRADVALAAGADGVHLPADGVPAGALRARFGGSLLIGVSTHRLEEVEQARRAGADYVLFGPVYPMPAASGHGPPVGLAALARAATLGIPVYALGGVTLERFAAVAAAGAAGVAGIRLFQRLKRRPDDSGGSVPGERETIGGTGGAGASEENGDAAECRHAVAAAREHFP
ncbi:MAG: thiamine phosphate synthase [Acidobacteria bacterium]|nr:thiamine phosphate synthase [Acidobacteriota bacterium]